MPPLPPVSRALRLSLAALMPPKATGIAALSSLAARLAELEREGAARRADAHELLVESGFASRAALGRVVRRRAAGLRDEVVEEVVAEVVARLDGIYDRWSGEGPFGAYFGRALEREAWAVARREARLAGGEPWREARDSEEAAEDPPRHWSPLEVQAMRRFAWYLYGSPDNPNRIRSDKAMVDYLAFKARLDHRPFSELVRDLQPRPGAWGVGRGEADCKWWRGRAQMAQRKIEEAMKKPRDRAVYERILSELRATEREGGGTEEARPGERGARARRAS